MEPIIEGLIGYQRPRLEHFPAYFTNLGDDAIDLAAVAGIELLPWQELIVRNSLGQTVENFWSSTSVCLITPRQNGKNVCVYARQLAGLCLLNERIMHSAHEFDTARDAHQELVTFIGNNPDLEDEFILPHKVGASERSIRHKSGSFIHYVARGNNSKRGRTRIDLMILDEAFALDDDMMKALSPLQQASRNPQLWYTTSAGTADSEVLTRVRDRGKVLAATPEPGATLMFAEWSCDEGSDPHNFENWKLANPSLGVLGIAPVARLREDYEEKMSIQGFAREHLGMWDDPVMNAVIPIDKYDACGTDEPSPDGPCVLSLDVSPARDRSSIAVAQKRPDSRNHVELIMSDDGTDWVLPTFQKLIASATNPPKAVAVYGQAATFAAELEQIGFKVYRFTRDEAAKACGQIYDAVLYRKITHAAQKEVKASLGAATALPVGNIEDGKWVWGRRTPTSDITAITACTNANRCLTLESVEETLNAKKPGRLLIGARH